MNPAQSKRNESTREEFPDGSALVTYADGSMLIVESDLATITALRESGSFNYNDSLPPPSKSAAPDSE
jgi:hypothetical protein